MSRHLLWKNTAELAVGIGQNLLACVLAPGLNFLACVVAGSSFFLLWCGSCFGVACWLPGFFLAFLGLLASWLPGFSVFWLLGFLASWLLGFLASWLLGCLASWLPGFLAFWLLAATRELLHLAVADAAAGDPCHQALDQPKPEKFT